MCGIVAYKGEQNCLPFLLNGLSKLEYRGYDSAGIGTLYNNNLVVVKKAGKIDNLKAAVPLYLKGNVGIGHTRWATHGIPNNNNSHPHVVFDNSLMLVHNGIIENSESIRKELKFKDKLKSDTDSEVLLYLIYEHYLESNNLVLAIKQSCKQIEGAFAFVLLSEKGQLICVRKGSPLVVGYSKDGVVAGSDGFGVADFCDKIIFMPNGSFCDLTNGFNGFISLNDSDLEPYKIEDSRIHADGADKEGFDHFMLKEIYDQPQSIDMCCRGRITDDNKIVLGGFYGYEKAFSDCHHITIVACGSSYHAGILGKYYIEELCGIKTSVEHASEFRYRTNNSIHSKDIVIGISQSGETADTLSALTNAKQMGAIVVGVTNSPNSAITQLTDCGMHIRAGKEIGVASTKAFSNQVVSLLLMALWIEQNLSVKVISNNYRSSIIQELRTIPEKLQHYLDSGINCDSVVDHLLRKSGCLYLGRGYDYPIALEGSLKLKELCYIHAEGYAAGEMKHGPIALIDKDSVVICLVNNKSQYMKMVNNIKEIQARGANIITIGDSESGEHNIPTAQTLDILSPLFSVIPLQLLAYYATLAYGYDVDKPRNLAKSVTVE